MILTIVVGDWSGDGHGMTSETNIETNFTESQFEKALKLGEERAKFKLDRICTSYEDSSFRKSILNSLRTLGFQYSIEDEEDCEGDVVYLSPEDYVNICLFLVKLGDSNFEFRIIESPKINIGGYGLLSN